MGQRRRAEASDVRQWDGDVAARNDLDEVRTWVVWGVGADPSTPDRAAAPEDEEPRGRPGNDIARTIAAENDPEWANTAEWDVWVILLDADEGDVDGWTQDDERVRGYAPYLLQAAEPDTGLMEGTLRNDKVVRRTGGERLD
ncbi:MAG: hypothetical protein M3144_03515, partial [Actinomycetota bacterium]|nr:hypothetical protein [Actinomycetota bacterium]